MTENERCDGVSGQKVVVSGGGGGRGVKISSQRTSVGKTELPATVTGEFRWYRTV